MGKLIISSAPHIHSGASEKRIMLDVILALLPTTIAAGLIFGARAWFVIAACTASCVIWELLFDLLTHKGNTVGDLSAALTGLLLGLNLSSSVPVWQCIIGSGFAVVIVKCLFGGLGHNFANPAITGRIFMLLCFTGINWAAMPVDAVSSATPLAILAGQSEETLPTLGNMLLGLRGGAVGESCILALLIGYAYLVWRKVIRWYVPAAFIATVFLLYLITGGFTHALYEILSGGLVLGAVFMATDYVTTPINDEGRIVFAIGCGLVTFVIREFCAYPEGVSFSILAMNILTPFIERWTAKKPLGGS